MAAVFMNSSWSYFVVDQPSFQVLWHTHNPVAANNVSFGFINSVVISMKKAVENAESPHRKMNFDTDIYKIDWFLKIEKIEQQRITPAFLEQRRLAERRGRFFIEMETICRRILVDRHFYFLPEAESHISFELLACRPDENYFPRSVEDYAQRLGIDNFAAYQELKITILSHRATTIRNYAIFKKYSELVNRSNTAEAIDSLLQAAAEEIFAKASI
jgi:hypothetical protein